MRTREDTETYCWNDGAWQWPRQTGDSSTGFYGDATEYEEDLHVEFLPARIACIEFETVSVEARRVVAFGDAEIEVPDKGPDVVLRESAVERFDVTLEHVGGPADPFGADRRIGAFVDDQDGDGYGLAIGIDESRERVGDVETVRVAWFPEEEEHDAVFALRVASGRPEVDRGWGLANVPIEEVRDSDHEAFELMPPTGFVIEDGVLRVEGPYWDWDDLYLILSENGFVGPSWEIVLPPGVREWTMPVTRPDGRPLGELGLLFAGAFEYDVGPPDVDEGTFELYFWSRHLRVATYGHPNVDDLRP